MSASRNNGDEVDKRKSEFYSSAMFGLLGFVVTFVVLRWVIF
jgi:hypothetical protein